MLASLNLLENQREKYSWIPCFRLVYQVVKDSFPELRFPRVPLRGMNYRLIYTYRQHFRSIQFHMPRATEVKCLSWIGSTTQATDGVINLCKIYFHFLLWKRQNVMSTPRYLQLLIHRRHKIFEVKYSQTQLVYCFFLLIRCSYIASLNDIFRL